MNDQDGLRVTSTRDIGGYRATQMHNPVLIAEIMAERTYRKTIKTQNEKVWG